MRSRDERPRHAPFSSLLRVTARLNESDGSDGSMEKAAAGPRILTAEGLVVEV